MAPFPTRGSELLRISIIIPAHNEYERLPALLPVVRLYLDRNFDGCYEVIVVDDGSTDGLQFRLRSLQRAWRQLRVLQHQTNKGKGAAVRTGMLAARGELLLFQDADGATPIDEERKLRSAIERGSDIAIGVRGTARSFTAQPFPRWLASVSFSFLVRRLLGLSVSDTQCGFKMFRREAASVLFPSSQEAGYLFDVEILAIARVFQYAIAEVPVAWSPKSGSRVRLFSDSWKMLQGLLSLSKRFASALSSEHVTRHAGPSFQGGDTVTSQTARLFGDKLRMRIMHALREHEHNVACRGGGFYLFGLLEEFEARLSAEERGSRRRIRHPAKRFTDPAINRFFACSDHDVLEFLETCFASKAVRRNSATAEAA